MSAAVSLSQNWRMTCWCVRSIRMRRLIYTVWPALFPLVRCVKSLGVISPVRLLHSNLSMRLRKWGCFKSIFLLSSPCTSVFNLHDNWSVYVYVIVSTDWVIRWCCCVGWQQWQNSGHHQSARGKLRSSGGMWLLYTDIYIYFWQCHQLLVISYIMVHAWMSVDVCLYVGERS